MNFSPYDNVPIPLFIADHAGRLEYVNTVWQELICPDPLELWSDAFDAITPERIEHIWDNCVALGGCTETFLRHTEAYEVSCRVFNHAQKTMLLGTVVNVTNQHRMSAESNAILETAVDGIVIIDQDGTIETFNRAAAELFGYSPEEVIGQPVSLLMPEPYRSTHHNFIQHYLTSGLPKIIGIGRELQAIDKNGRLFPMYLAVSEISLEGRKRFTGIIRDLTGQHAAREALTEHRQRLAHVDRLSSMGEMTASIAHEINQPLTAISIYAQTGINLLQRRDTDLAKLQSALDKLNTQSLRAGSIIERIQRFARGQESQREHIDVNELVMDLIKLSESDARLHNIEIVPDLGKGLPKRFADPIQIQQVVLNLIRNAIDAMTEIDCRHGRTITIHTHLLPGHLVEIAVSDLGPGVTEEQRALIFAPFHTTKREGMGMGLSICRSIISEHGGTMGFHNNDGVGATFYFQMPRVNNDE